MYRLLRPFLFKLPTEFTHHFALKILKWTHSTTKIQRLMQHFPQKPCTLYGWSLPNPVGLAAGLDKNGDYIDALFALGFGFIEVGAVTPKAQSGNPKPRLFRLPKARALINRMGFNNKGVDYLIQRLKARKITGIVGINIGKNLSTPLVDAYQDYAFCFRAVYPYADFVTINISSPNTAGLRELQGEDYLVELLQKLKTLQKNLELKFHKKVPLLVKIAPDLSQNELIIMSQIFLKVEIDGIIAVNTTLERESVKNLKYGMEKGGLSGQPLLQKTLRIVTELQKQTAGKIPIIAVGGIMSATDAKMLLNAGASLVQIYTGLIYKGPNLVREIVDNL